MKYNKYLIGDICNFIDYRGKTPPKTSFGIPLITAKIIKNGIIQEPQEFIDEALYDEWMRRGIPKKGDIILTTEAPLGEVAKIKTNEKMAFAQRVIILEPNNSILDSDYLFYALQDRVLKGRIEARSSGTTVFGIKAKELKKVEIQIPSIEIQRKIGSILSSIDDKIETNTAINKNLEEQAQAIYKSWFVDFEPFGGLPPSSWTKEDIYSIAKIIYGAPFSSKLFNTERKGMPIVRIRDLKGQNLETYTTEKHPKGHLIKPGDIVVGMDGEFRPHIWGNSEAWLNQRVCIFENLRPKGKAFLLFSIKPLLNIIEQTQVATTVIHIGKKDYDAFEITMPSSEVLDRFDEMTNPIIKQIVNNQLENKQLKELRDTLLPRLMSGEIDVSDIEI
ncbi:restriction endonuclease subunit S [Schwartzia succinivorans]|jgi:type I restriction enzyme S subunit|uniref:Type I restriction enzyme, S subunit n=1 Tax=Schwartzia succinivorans DSM 10502 TaxID=1123243 RepID=A0A1M4WE88_9FIRM|nr:restriction endonuclease subunit S [Schwartzia succinivorans]SHE79282.1 type I restriction enzyme, S subunit [Schwartzia succinivorans DSM 10502]